MLTTIDICKAGFEVGYDQNALTGARNSYVWELMRQHQGTALIKECVFSLNVSMNSTKMVELANIDLDSVHVQDMIMEVFQTLACKRSLTMCSCLA